MIPEPLHYRAMEDLGKGSEQKASPRTLEEKANEFALKEWNHFAFTSPWDLAVSLAQFAAHAVAEERERCAKIADGMANNWGRHQLSQLELGRHAMADLASTQASAARDVARAIRGEDEE
jgi:hypothetical protein